jgi:hypothetical protein
MRFGQKRLPRQPKKEVDVPPRHKKSGKQNEANPGSALVTIHGLHIVWLVVNGVILAGREEQIVITTFLTLCSNVAVRSSLSL